MFLQIIRQCHQRHEAFLKAVVYVSFEIEIGINSDKQIKTNFRHY